MEDNKDALLNLDAKIVSDIVEAVMTSIKADSKVSIKPVSKVSLKDYIEQAENDDHDLSAYDVAELFDLVHASRGEVQLYDLPIHQQNAAAATIRAAYDLGQDDAEELRIDLEEAKKKLAQLEEAVTRPLEDPKDEKKRFDAITSAAWKTAVEWVKNNASGDVDIRKMELANPFDPNKFPPTEHGTVISGEGNHSVVETKDGLEFLTLTYMEPSNSWVGVEEIYGDIRHVETKNIKPGTWKVVE